MGQEQLVKKTFEPKSRSQRGASMVEYAVLLMLIVLVGLVALRGFGGKVSAQFSDINDSLDIAF